MLIQEPLGMLGLRHDGADGGLGALELQVLLLVEVGLSVATKGIFTRKIVI